MQASIAVAASLWDAQGRCCNTLSAALTTGKRLQRMSQRISTSAIIASCKARRSDSNSSGVAVGSDPMRLVNQHSHFGKRSRHNEAVPTSQPPAARIFQIHWQHRRAGFLRKKNYPWTQFVSRATRTVRSNYHIATGGEHLV